MKVCFPSYMLGVLEIVNKKRFQIPSKERLFIEKYFCAISNNLVKQKCYNLFVCFCFSFGNGNLWQLISKYGHLRIL